MLVLADNDIILKFAQCGILDHLHEILGLEVGEIYVTPTARFQLLPKKEGRALAKCGDDRTLTSVRAFLDVAKDIADPLDSELLSRLASHEGIDAGEQLLFAFAVTNASRKPLILTGDKTSLRAVLLAREALPDVHECLVESTVIFESGLLLALGSSGFAVVSERLFAAPKLDGALRLVVKEGMRENDLQECLISYSRDVSVYLAFPDLLPKEIFRSPDEG